MKRSYFRPESVKFYDKNGKNFELSAFYRVVKGFIYNDAYFSTAEHAYQAQKFLHSGESDVDISYAVHISNVDCPHKAKFLANLTCSGKEDWQKENHVVIKQYKKLGVSVREDWDDVKDSIMKDIMVQKFQQDPISRRILLSTEGKKIYCDDPDDEYWSRGKSGRGQNRLGKMLENIRNDIIEENNREDDSDIFMDII